MHAKLCAQYANAPKLRAYIHALTQWYGELKTFFEMFEKQMTLKHAQGAQLDTLGTLLGKTRHLKQRAQVVYFGFEDTPQAQVFGIGLFYNEGDPLDGMSVLPDDLFRQFLRARIVQNGMRSTADDVFFLMKPILALMQTEMILEDHGCMAAYISFPTRLPHNWRVIFQSVDFLPKLIGVRLAFGVHFDRGGSFGFDDTPQAQGWDGGPFAEQICF